MCQIVGGVEIVTLDGSVEQGPQGADAKSRGLAQALEGHTGVCVFLRLRRANLQCSEIELVEIVLGFFFDRGGELFLLLSIIAFCSGQPTGDNMKSGAVTQTGGDMVERLSGDVEAAKAQGRRSKVQLTIQIVR